MQKLCHCSKQLLDLDHCTYAVNSVPCCSEACFNAALAAQGKYERGQAARDVPIGTSWAFHEHRTMAQVLREEGHFDVV